MDRYNERQTSTVFADEPPRSASSPTTTTLEVHSTAAVAAAVDCGDTTDATTRAPVAACCPTQQAPLSSSPNPEPESRLTSHTTRSSTGPAAVAALAGAEVTEGCRSCISAASQEQKREYFLRQKCPLTMAWARIAGSAPSTMATFEEHAANSLRTSSSASHHGRRDGTPLRRARTESSVTRRHRSSSSGSSSALQAEAAASAQGEGQEDGETGAAAEGCTCGGECGCGAAAASAVMPPPRFGHTAVLYKDSQMIVFGGKANDEHYYNDVYAYDVERRRWAVLLPEDAGEPTAPAVAPSSPQSAESPGTTTTTTTSSSNSSSSAPQIVSSGRGDGAAQTAAEDGMSRQCSEVSHSSPHGSRQDSTVATAARGPLRPCGRVGHAAALYQNSMYVLSGERQGKFFDDMWTLDLPTLTWTKECGLPFSPRKGHTMHLLPAESTATRARDDMLVVFGGLVKASRLHARPADPELPPRGRGEPDMMCAPTNVTLLYYPAQRRWCQLKTCGDEPTPRFYHVSQLVTGTSLLLTFGGRTVAATPAGTTTAASEGAFMNDLHLLDVSTGVWRQLRDVTGEIPTPRMCAASVFVNGTFAVFAGGGDGYCRSAYEFQLSRKRWRRLSPNNQPACSRPTVTYAKDRLVFFGGFAPRMGVMNCTMELCLAPLSLTNQCLLWWNRCAFEKHVRTCTQNRLLEKEERAAALAAIGRCGSGSCGKQVTLHRSPAHLAGSGVPAQHSAMRRATRRPASFVMTAASERGTSWSASHNGLPVTSPGSPAPSSPGFHSPLSAASQSVPSWYETAAAASTHAVAAGGGLYCAANFRGSPASVSTAASAMRAAHNAFPSRPDTASSMYGCSTAGTPTIASQSAQTSVTHGNAWGRCSTVAPGPNPWQQQQPSASYDSAHYHPYPPPQHNGGGVAMAVRTWTDGVQPASARSSRSSLSGPSQPPSNTPSATSRLGAGAAAQGEGGPGGTPQDAAPQSCRMIDCVRNIGSLVTASIPRLYYGQPAQATTQGQQQQQALGRGVGSAATHSYASCATHGGYASVPQPSSAAHPLRVDTSTRSPPSPHLSDRSGRQPSSPVSRAAATASWNASSSAALPSPFSQAGGLRSQQRQTSVHVTESASSRGSSVHSVRSAASSSEAVALSQVTQLIRRLEGPNGPFLFRAMAARVQEHVKE